MMSGGREVDVGGVVPDYKYGHNKPESEFLTGQAEYSWSYERLGSCLAVERSMMKSSTLFHVFECGPLPPYVQLTSTWRHSRDRCSQAFPVFRTLPLLCIILNANWRTKNGGGLGTRLVIIHSFDTILYVKVKSLAEYQLIIAFFMCWIPSLLLVPMKW